MAMATVSESAAGGIINSQYYHCTTIIMLSSRHCSFADERRIAWRGGDALRAIRWNTETCATREHARTTS